MVNNKPVLSNKSFKEASDDLIHYLELKRTTRKYDLNQYKDRKALENVYMSAVEDCLSAFEEAKSDHGTASDFRIKKKSIRKKLSYVMQLLPEVQSRFSNLYPNICVEELFASLNGTFVSISYDTIDVFEKITLAAVIWILDELESQGDLDKIQNILSDDVNIGYIRIPDDFDDSCFDVSLIEKIQYIVENRNDDIDNNPKGIDKVYINDAVLKRQSNNYTQSEQGEELSFTTNRQRFNYIISLLNPSAVRRAAEHFEESWWEAFRRYIECINIYRSEEIELLDRLCADLSRYKTIHSSIVQRKNKSAQDISKIIFNSNPLLARQPSLDDFINQTCVNSLTDHTDIISKSAEERESDRLLQQILENKKKLNNLECLQEVAPYFTTISGSDESLLHDDEVRMIPDLRLLYDLEVSNPFETCFALLYLLDSGNHLPWLSSLGTIVIQAAINRLPWHKFPEFTDDEEEDDDDDVVVVESDDIICDNPIETTDADDKSNADSNNCDNDLVDYTELESEYYKRNYSYPRYVHDTGEYEKNENSHINFSQFVFSQTKLLAPRKIHLYHDMCDYYALAGFDKKEANILGLYMTLANTLYSKKYSDRLFEAPLSYIDDESEEKSSTDTQADNDTKGLKQNLIELKDEIKNYHNANRNLQKEIEKLRQENQELSSELSELRTMVKKTASNDDHGVPEVISSVAFPYTAKGRYVVFGGHDSWLKAIKPLLADVRFIDINVNPNVGLIAHADTVWIQSNAIKHSNYYKIVNVAKAYGIKIEFFSYASAEKCAEQLAVYDMDQNV